MEAGTSDGEPEAQVEVGHGGIVDPVFDPDPFASLAHRWVCDDEIRGFQLRKIGPDRCWTEFEGVADRADGDSGFARRTRRIPAFTRLPRMATGSWASSDPEGWAYRGITPLFRSEARASSKQPDLLVYFASTRLYSLGMQEATSHRQQRMITDRTTLPPKA